MSAWFVPIARAISQFDDSVFRGVVLRSLAWALGCFIALHVAMIWALYQLLALHGWLAWAADILGSVGASLLTFWLFLPVAAGIATLYCDRVASAVECRFYPWLPRAAGASLFEQTWDNIAVALNVLVLSFAALVLAFAVPGLGLLLGWMVASYAIGRGLFFAVAMRRMPRTMAESLYRRHKGVVLLQGGMLALAAFIPILNLFIPVVGTAAMVHIVDSSTNAVRRSDNDQFDIV